MLTRKQRAELSALDTQPNRLAHAMELAGVTQVQLAEAVGLTQPYISRIKNGQYGDELPGETMRRLAAFFGCSIETLFPAPIDRCDVA